MAAGEAAASPADADPPEEGGGLPQAVTRQASTAGQAAAVSSRARLARARPGRITVWLALLAVGVQPLNVSMFSIFHRPPWRRAVTANIAPA